MIDVHCHLQFHSFQNDYDVVAKEAFAAGITKIINVGTKLDSSQKAIELAERYEQMYAIVGVHPHHADMITFSPQPNPLTQGERKNISSSHARGEDRGEGGKGWIKELEYMARHPKVIGIGEVGLDYFSYKSNGIVDPQIQKDVFKQQVELSYRTGLPLQIHNRQAGEDVIEILKHHKNILQSIPGMFHCFAGSFDVLKNALDLGFYIGFDGNVTYKGIALGESTDLKDLAKYVPLDRLVVETDSPFLTPVPLRGQRNSPANVIITGKFLAEIKNVDFDMLVEQTTKNVYNIFGRLRPS